jgi:oligoribonuclease
MGCLWIDLETTGLDPTKHTILEVAAVITNDDLEILEEYSEIIKPDGDLTFGQAALGMHMESELLNKLKSGTCITDVLCAKHFPNRTDIVLFGNTIGFDRKFIDRHMPSFASFLHYRMVDVSSFKMFFSQCLGKSGESLGIVKAVTHRALDDIKESIIEMRVYRDLII